MLFMCIPRELRCLGSSFEGKRRDLCCFPHPSGIPAASHCRLMEGKEGFPLGVRQCSLSLCCCCCVFPTTPPSACPLLPICRVCYLCACPWPCTVRISFTKICFMFSCSPFHVFGVIFLYANINIDRCWGGGGVIVCFLLAKSLLPHFIHMGQGCCWLIKLLCFSPRKA